MNDYQKRQHRNRQSHGMEYRLLVAEEKKYRIDLTTELGIDLANFELALNYYNMDKVEGKAREKTSKKK